MIGVGLSPSEVGGGSPLVLMPPSGMESNCEPLYVVSQVYADGTNCLLSRWAPSPEEREAIAKGADVLLYIFGTAHPPVAVSIVHEEERG